MLYELTQCTQTLDLKLIGTLKDLRRYFHLISRIKRTFHRPIKRR